jgi:hypothetical protein
LLVGFGALWMEGWLPRLPLPQPSPWAGSSQQGMPSLFPGGGVADVAAYLSYFGLAFFALRWWRMADPRRSQRFSFGPILAAGFWGLILLLIWPQAMRGAGALLAAPIIIQLVSPWEAPPPSSKRMRLRHA